MPEPPKTYLRGFHSQQWRSEKSDGPCIVWPGSSQDNVVTLMTWQLRPGEEIHLTSYEDLDGQEVVALEHHWVGFAGGSYDVETLRIDNV